MGTCSLPLTGVGFFYAVFFITHGAIVFRFTKWRTLWLPVLLYVLMEPTDLFMFARTLFCRNLVQWTCCWLTPSPGSQSGPHGLMKTHHSCCSCIDINFPPQIPRVGSRPQLLIHTLPFSYLEIPFNYICLSTWMCDCDALVAIRP